jgi:hypothetical protein
MTGKGNHYLNSRNCVFKIFHSMVKTIILFLGMTLFTQKEIFKISEQKALDLVRSIPFVKKSLNYKYPKSHNTDNELIVDNRPTQSKPFYIIILAQVDDVHMNTLHRFRVNAISGKVEYYDALNKYSSKEYLSLKEWEKFRKKIMISHIINPQSHETNPTIFTHDHPNHFVFSPEQSVAICRRYYFDYQYLNWSLARQSYPQRCQYY